MDAGTFTFNGRSSTSFGILAQYKPDRLPPTRDFNIEKPSNRSGSIYRSMGTYPNTTIKLELWFKVKNVSHIDDVADWLNTSDYVNYVPWYDPTYTYKAIVEKVPTFKYHKSNNDYITFDLELSLLPFKYLSTTLSTSQAVSSGSVLTNPYQYESLPLIAITASNKGDVVLKINQKEFKYKSFSGTLKSDSAIPKSSMPTKTVGLDFPVLHKGNNTITFKNADSVKITPRWNRRAL